MDREQVKFLLTVLGVIIWVGGAIYERYKKNMARRRPNVTPRRSVRPATVQVSQTSHPASAKISAKPASGLSVSFDDEGRSYFTPPADEAAPSQSDDAATTGETTEDRRLEDLRRAVIWSEILRRKF